MVDTRHDFDFNFDGCEIKKKETKNKNHRHTLSRSHMSTRGYCVGHPKIILVFIELSDDVTVYL